MEDWLLGLEQGWALGQGRVPLVDSQGLEKMRFHCKGTCSCYLLPFRSFGDFQVYKYIIFF